MSEIVDKAKALVSTYEQLLEHTRTERDALRAELEKLRCELDDAEERASEAEERCAAEWEKDCGQALRILAQVTKFEWDQDGSPADEVREHIQITIESLEKQVLSLRAELAAAKNLLARIHRDGGHHTEAVGFARSVADAGDKVSEWLLAAEDRTALAAHVERLRNALEWSKSYWPEQEESRHSPDCCCPMCDVNACIEEAEAALAATPAQSLAAHEAALLREVANLIRQTTPDPTDGVPESFGSHQGRMYALEQILAEADRIAKEAAPEVYDVWKEAPNG
jgi:hypothetical protein